MPLYQSNNIETFLDWIRECGTIYNINLENEMEAVAETQDILHKLELDETTYHEKAKLAKTLSDVRKKRRESKDNAAILEPIVNWRDCNKQAIHSLEKLLGEVRKEEAKTEGRAYYPRTEVVQKALE